MFIYRRIIFIGKIFFVVGPLAVPADSDRNIFPDSPLVNGDKWTYTIPTFTQRPPPPYREFLCLTGEGVDPILFHCLLTGKTHEYNLFCTFYYGVINQFPD